ncbi:hypothetical protein [Nocardioides sp. URHA0020]|uniref:hypothetical protein n=1 Tax=Nocardioides sp. URHA0020 TaxID=1380392 RepID=UPI0012DC31B0|nr:hypothetical protein [Nocardioides sp. URHA0020]
MTDPADLDAERIAELQRQLAEATEQVARVHAELAGAGRGSGAQLVDRLAARFAGPPRTPDVAPLAPPPRSVPIAFRLAVFSWSWWEQFGLVIGFTGPIALWGFFPWTIPLGLIAALVTIVVLRGRRSWVRLRLLKWGQVASVTGAQELSQGTYYSGVTYSNMIVPQARGWDVTRDFYSGPATTTQISYSLAGVPGTLRLRGLPYDDGVVLADSRKPSVALCVSSFPYAVKPDAGGELVGRLRARAWLGIVLTMLIEAGLVVATVASIDAFWR